uniref:Uncharacterized protein n=1 Tax=Acrobeloides nanus TaxID=290746 RepID=A0A914CWQ1_9BILA
MYYPTTPRSWKTMSGIKSYTQNKEEHTMLNSCGKFLCGKSVRKIFVRKILYGQFLKKLCDAYVPIAVRTSFLSINCGVKLY